MSKIFGGGGLIPETPLKYGPDCMCQDIEKAVESRLLMFEFFFTKNNRDSTRITI